MSAAPSRRKPRRQEADGELAALLPEQGDWTEEEYLALTTNRLVEFDNGFIEVLPVPTTSHQKLLRFLFLALLNFVEPRKLGEALSAGIRVRLWKGKFRQPDIVFMLAKHAERIGEDFWKGADLVMEIVSNDPKDRYRDLVKKRREYARAGIPEYWIVDPKKSQIVVLRLAGRTYGVAGAYGRKDKAKSVLLKGFEVDVAAALAAK